MIYNKTTYLAKTKKHRFPELVTEAEEAKYSKFKQNQYKNEIQLKIQFQISGTFKYLKEAKLYFD